MNKFIKIEKYEYKMDHTLEIPDSCKKSIFIPAFGKDNLGYYYLVDFRTNIITCWVIDNEVMKKELKKRMHTVWDDDAEYFFVNFLAAHSAQYYKNKIYVYSLNSNYIIVIDLERNAYDVLYDENIFDWVFSATNDIYNNELYFARWSLADKLRIFNDVYSTIHIEVGKVNLDSRKFTILGSFESSNTIHEASVTPDGKKVILLGMSTAPVGRFPNPTSEFKEKEMLDVLQQGLLKSQMNLYDMETSKISTINLEAGTGHIEYDRKNNIGYISNHNLGYDAENKNIYCFGEGKIDKIIIDRQVDFIDSYTDDDFIRIPSHKIFDYNHKTLIAVSVYPNKVHIIDSQDMKIYKKATIMRNRHFTDFTKGPEIYPKIDRTPYTVHPVNGSQYVYLANVWNVRLFDFEKDEVICTVNYNFNKKPLLTMGHALDF